MRSLILLFGFMLCFSSAYGQIWKSKSSSDSGLFGGGSNNQTINIGDTGEVATESSTKSNRNWSEWNLDAEAIGYLIPDQATNRFVVGPISLGTTYKFSEHIQIVYKYVKFEFDGNADTEWSMESHLIGAGFRKYFNGGEMEFVANVGSGTSTLKEKTGQVDLPAYEAPIFADITFNYVMDNLSFGPRFSYVTVDTKEETPMPMKGGYVYVGLAFQFGLPE
jgi:hypothetical protein